MPISMPFGLKIAIINRMFKKRLDDKAKELGLTSAQLRVLGTISRLEAEGKGEIHQTDLEKIEHVSHPAMTKMLHRLEDKKLITVTPYHKDKRYNTICCFNEAVAIYNVILAHDEEVFDEICRNLSLKQKDMIRKSMDLLLEEADFKDERDQIVEKKKRGKTAYEKQDNNDQP